MARMHTHIAVDDLEANIRFYSALFGAEPNVIESDYAKWKLADPAVNDQEPALANQDCPGSACCVPTIPVPFTVESMGASMVRSTAAGPTGATRRRCPWSRARGRSVATSRLEPGPREDSTSQ